MWRKAGWEEGETSPRTGHAWPAFQCIRHSAWCSRQSTKVLKGLLFPPLTLLVLKVLVSPTLLAPVFYLIKKQGPLTLGALRPLTSGAPAPVNRSPQPRTTSGVPGLPGPAAGPPTPRSPPPGFQARRYAETPGLDPLLRVIRMDRGPENRSG